VAQWEKVASQAVGELAGIDLVVLLLGCSNRAQHQWTELEQSFSRLVVASPLRRFWKGRGGTQATKDFEALKGTEQTLGNVKVKELSNGSKAVLRNFSGDGRPTLEIQNATGTTKFRYN
jgi:hypothetical protein